MHSANKILTGILSAFAMLLLILDAKTAILGAREGLEICLYTVVPSLFPFLFLSVLITSAMTQINLRFLRPAGKLCGIPTGSELLLAFGLISGYPVGAQMVTQACEGGQISRVTAHRLLGFCSNAGPAFIFGISSSLFSGKTVPWVLWSIHIASAVIVGIMLPGKENTPGQTLAVQRTSASGALQQSLKTMALISGWIILFRVFINFCDRWFFWLLSNELRILLIGLLELTNGYVSLSEVPSETMRFLLAVVMLNCGGLCVSMQTITVTGKIGVGYYFPGKLLQTLISTILACCVIPLLFPPENFSYLPTILLSTLTISGPVIYLFCLRKKTVAILS